MTVTLTLIKSTILIKQQKHARVCLWWFMVLNIENIVKHEPLGVVGKSDKAQQLQPILSLSNSMSTRKSMSNRQTGEDYTRKDVLASQSEEKSVMPGSFLPSTQLANHCQFHTVTEMAKTGPPPPKPF